MCFSLLTIILTGAAAVVSFTHGEVLSGLFFLAIFAHTIITAVKETE